MPGLLAVAPPRKTARGRERDQFVAYLMLSGNASVSTGELMKITNDAAGSFYQSQGPMTSAMRKAADQHECENRGSEVQEQGREDRDPQLGQHQQMQERFAEPGAVLDAHDPVTG